MQVNLPAGVGQNTFSIPTRASSVQSASCFSCCAELIRHASGEDISRGTQLQFGFSAWGPWSPNNFKWNSFCTCVVILSAVAQILLLLQHKLGEGEIVSHLNGVLRQPLEDQVVHGVTNCEKRPEEMRRRGKKTFKSGGNSKKCVTLAWIILNRIDFEFSYFLPLNLAHSFTQILAHLGKMIHLFVSSVNACYFSRLQHSKLTLRKKTRIRCFIARY